MIVPRGLRSANAIIAATLFVSLIAGCSQQDQSHAQSVADDALIAAQVRAKIAVVDPATVSLVHVTSDRGAVTLSGKIKTAKERTDVENAARGVSGVKSLTDDIVLDPAAPTAGEMESDLALSARIRAALAAQTGVNVAAVHVDVHRGVVTLTGELPSAAHREVADQTVRKVPGVVKLIDNITVANH